MVRKKKNETNEVTQNVFTLSALNEIHNEFEEQKEVQFKYKDKIYNIKIDKKFQLSKLNDILDEFKKIIKDMRDNNIELIEDNMNKLSQNLMYVLVLKKYTNLPIEDGLDVVQLQDVLRKMINIGLFKFIWNSFDEDQVVWLNQKIQDATISQIKSVQEGEKALEEIRKLIEDIKPSEVDDNA